jgi:predicted enzyme related to lactoylglutathione lyase
MSGPLELVHRWAKGIGARLEAEDDRWAALASALAGSAAIWLVLRATYDRDPTAIGATIVARHFWPIAGVVTLLAVMPARVHRVLQCAALATLFVTYQLEEQGTRTKNLITLAMWVASILLCRVLPLKRDLLRKVLIVTVTLSLPLLARRLAFEQGVVLVQLMFACEVLARGERRSWAQCLRATSAPMTVMPPSDLLASNRAGSSILMGTGMVAVGLAAFRAFDRIARCGSSPYFFCVQSLGLSISDAIWVHPGPASLAWAVVRDLAWLANFALQYTVFTGLLNAVGIPMRFITGNLLRVRNLFDYWKTANRWQYELLRTVYLDNFFAIGRGWRAAVGIVCVFLVSGLHHVPGRLPAAGSLASNVAGSEARWLVFGVLCAASYQWRVYVVRRRLRASLRAQDATPRAPAKVLGPLALFAVLSVSGLLIAGDEVFGAVRPYWVVSSDGPEGFRKQSFYTSLDYGGPLRPAIPIEGATTSDGPSMAALDDALYVVWRDARTRGLRWTRGGDGGWTRPTPIEGAAAAGPPAVATLGRRLFVAWREGGEGGKLMWVSREDGVWSPVRQMIGARPGYRVSLAAAGDRLFASWSSGADDELWWASFDGSRWEPPRRIDDAARGGTPALASLEGGLYATWRGSGSLGHKLWWSRFDGHRWAAPQLVPGADVDSDPAATALDGRLDVAWRSAGLDSNVQWASFDGVWAPLARTGLSTCDRPAIAAYRGYLVLAWRGREAERCEDPSDYGGLWDLRSVYWIDLPRSSSSAKDTLGRVVWRTLRTTNPSDAAAFYADVVGWRAEVEGRDDLTLANSRGALAGVSKISDDDLRKGVRPYWAPTLAVADVDAVAARAVSAGGHLFVAPRPASDNARFAVIGDPVGGVLDISSLVGAPRLHDSAEPGDFYDTVFMTRDGDAAVRFYGDLFGWRPKSEPLAGTAAPEAAPGPRWAPGSSVELTLGRRDAGTVRVVSGEGSSWWLFYIEVRDLDAAVRRATSRGGKLRIGPIARPEGGRIAELVDPQGVQFGLHEPERGRR